MSARSEGRPSVILERRQRASVRVNGVYVPINSVKYALERFSRPLLFHNADTPFQVSGAGSCFLARAAGENLLIATRHQLGNPARDETDVCITLYDDPASSKATLLTPSGGIHVSYGDPAAKFLEDLLILSFVRHHEKLEQLATNFLRIDAMSTLADVDQDRIFYWMTIAWPTNGKTVVLSPDEMSCEEFRNGFVRLALEPHDVPSLEKHIAFRVREREPKIRDFDGYSGAPVFFLYLDDARETQVGWAGIIRLGGNGILHAYAAADIRTSLRRDQRS
jgi:hypothetical protein